MLRKDPNIVVAEAPSAAVWYIVLNTQKTNPPLNNKLVRQAMNYAVNKEAIVRDILKGTGIDVDEWKEKPMIEKKDEEWFKKVVKACFGYRRKTLLNALKHSELSLHEPMESRMEKIGWQFPFGLGVIPESIFTTRAAIFVVLNSSTILSTLSAFESIGMQQGSQPMLLYLLPFFAK
jgi:ABC-type transport system substrate-binding protein